MSAIWVCWPKIFFPHRLSSFRNKRHILYPNYTLSFNKLSCECAIVVLFPRFSFLFVYFYSDTKVIFRTQLFPSFSFSFTLKRKTHPVSFRNERHILLHSETKGTSYTPTIPFQNNSVWVGKVSFFTMVHIFSFILLISEYVLKTQTISFLFLVFHFEGKDIPSPIVFLPFLISLFCLVFLIF